MRGSFPRIIVFLMLMIGVGGYLFYLNQSSSFDRFVFEDEDSELPKELRIREALAWNFEITKDIDLGYPPTEKLAEAIDHTKRLQDKYYGNSNSRDGLDNARWKERGPSNIGGRTRSLLIDLNDESRNKIWAGGVSGGLWYTNDITSNPPTWNKVNDYFDNLSIGAIAQDPNNPNYMYFGTGEQYTSFPGNGLFRSSDGGETWERIPSTLVVTGNNRYQYTQAMLVHPETSDVYVGTWKGVYRSKNNGDTWEEVLLGNSGSSQGSIIYDLDFAGGHIFASTRNRIYKSATGDEDSWSVIGSGFSNLPSSWARLEFSICDEDPDVIYAIGSSGGGASKVYVSFDGGEQFLPRARPENQDGSEFTNGQVWYDLDIAVNPFDCNHIVVGGVPTLHSFGNGLSFNPTNEVGHVDQHAILFDPMIEGRIIHGNDGGVYFREDGSTGTIRDKNNGYNVTQFYSCALHPEAFSNYILGGTQDNNSLRMNAAGIATAQVVLGGDGMFCHIDQDDGMIQVVSSQFGNYSISTDGGQSYSTGVNVNGSFINISDFDDEANILYAQTFDGDLYRFFVNSNDGESGVVSTGVSNPTAITADPNTEDRLYLGANGGRVFRVDNAATGSDLDAVQLASFGGTVISIDVQHENPDHLLVTLSNYGFTNNIFESIDGGENWVGVEGSAVADNLPNVPVRWGVFHPEDPNQVLIATEVGVWGTDNLDGDNTIWYPPVPGRGTPLVRTDMLQVRTSDRIVLAATHGRGMFTTDVWADPKAIVAVPQVGYQDGEVFFNGSASVNADSYQWNLGDGGTSTQEDFTHIYNEIGSYEINLVINGGNAGDPVLSDEGSIKILPTLATPYTNEEEEYGGGFEGFPEQYGIEIIRGSSWELGNSIFEGKDGTQSGDFALVIAPDDEHYQKNTETNFYMSNFDLSDQTIYSLEFYAKFDTGPGRDGFNIEYSTDKGLNWSVLGEAEPNWYNFDNNAGNTSTLFPFGVPFFSGDRLQFTKYTRDLTFLAGEADVAFRFVFKAGNGLGNYAGVVIDDFAISKLEGEARTNIVQQGGSFFNSSTGQRKIRVNWTTNPEFYADKFDIMLSNDGISFERDAIVDATSLVRNGNTNYSVELNGGLDLYFIQIIAYSINDELSLADTLRAPVFILNRNGGESSEIEIIGTFPNPFVGEVTLVFSDFVEGNVQIEIFDMAGRLLQLYKPYVENASTVIDGTNLATGVYILRYSIEGKEAKTVGVAKLKN